MKEFLLKIVRNPGVRKAAVALLLAIAAAAGLSFSTGCASFGAFKPEALSAAEKVRAGVECRVAVLEPYLGDEAERVIVDAAAGQLDLVETLINLDMTPKDMIALARDFNACSDLK